MSNSLYTDAPLERTRRHFINSYPPFNVARRATDECLRTSDAYGLYLHIPYCPTICTYCFYKKFGRPSEAEVDHYLAYLKREIAMFGSRPDTSGRSVRTLYIGGGTPTVLTNRQLTELMTYVRDHIDLSTLEEFCCEIMPNAETATAEKLETLRRLGVQRLSFGVETFNEDLLRLHNRPCTRELYRWTYDTARTVGFEKINIDVMSGLGGATWDTWKSDIDTLLDWSVPSVAIYKTEVFYNTNMYVGIRNGKGPTSLISDEEEIEHIRYAHGRLQREGGYIVGNCLHLLKSTYHHDLHSRYVWEGGQLKGLGLSAHSCYADVLHQNASELDEYYALIDKSVLPIRRAHRLTARDRMSQAMVYGLKNLALNRASFVDRFGVDVMVPYGPVIERLVNDGALTLDDEWLRITPDHYIFADDVCRRFYLPEYEQMMLAHMDRAQFVELAVH